MTENEALEKANQLMKEMPWIIRPYDNGLSATQVILSRALLCSYSQGVLAERERAAHLIEDGSALGEDGHPVLKSAASAIRKG